MEVKIDRRFDLPVSVEQAWALLGDVRATASCMPGAEVTEQVSERQFKGIMRSRIGPASMTFSGQIEVLELDASTRTLRLLGKGGDTAGSAATMNLLARIEPGGSGDASVLVGGTTVSVSGRLAQFGSRLLLPVAETMLRTFVVNFAQKARVIPVTAGAIVAPSPGIGVQPAQLNLVSFAWESFRQWLSNLLGRRRR